MKNKKTESGLKIKGSVRLQVFDGDKCIHDTGFMDNLITSAGKAGVAGLVGNTGSVTAFTYLAVGTSSTAVAVSDTTLGSEIVDSGLARASATVSRVTTTVTNDTLSLTKTFTVTGTKTIEEIGIFNASSSGVLLGRRLTGSINVINGNSLVTTYNVSFA
jgi:hypothetical protein